MWYILPIFVYLKITGGVFMLDPRFNTCIHAARCGSLTQAASALFLSKQAVKKQIDSLEAELGFALFRRSSRGLELTAAGQQFVDGVEHLTGQYHQLVNRCLQSERRAGEQTLTILLPTHPKIYFEQAVVAYNRLYPQVYLNIVDTRKLSVLYDSRARLRTLQEGTVDVVFAPCTGEYDTQHLVFRKLNRLSYQCLLKPGHPLSAKSHITREDLAAFPVRINTVMDRIVYDHILDQESSLLPERIVYSEKDSFSVPLIISFCLNDGIFISKGDYLETLHPLIAIPFDPPFSVDNGLFYRKDAPNHVQNFIDLVCRDAGVTP